ncbi:hypothetical protein [Nocardia sp. AG03]|uniref:hypothetical protein n=1 Tax=Nocardia sp. AG03 TaxID=3025312 RepID=UPI0024182943|nr:hypothetical protein [Nocardia sp. AG03]
MTTPRHAASRTETRCSAWLIPDAAPRRSEPRTGSSAEVDGSGETLTGSLTPVWPRRIGSFALLAGTEEGGPLGWSWPTGAVLG